MEKARLPGRASQNFWAQAKSNMGVCLVAMPIRVGFSDQGLRGYFMSQEAEMAAKGKMFEDYKDLRSRLTVLEREANTLGLRIFELARVLTGSPAKITVVRERVVSIPSGDGRQEVDISKLDPDEIVKLISEIGVVAKSKIELGGKLRDLGMSVN